jgi:D-alanyl-D-alanine carboxypeptidase
MTNSISAPIRRWRHLPMLVLALSQAAGAGVTPPGADVLTTNEIARIDAAANRLLAAGAPGLSLAIIKHDAVVYTKGYGVMNLKSRRPVTATTRMEIGSLTMQFTAAAILQLSESGKLSLDDALGKYVPEYVVGRDITLRQLLQFTSGVPDYFPIDDAVAAKLFAQKASVNEVLDLFSGKPLDFAPGSSAAFGNTGYFLLSLVVERVSGLDYDIYLRRHIFAPAGMTQSTTMAEEAKIGDMASGYLQVGTDSNPAPKIEDSWGRGTFDIVSNVLDIAKWDAALLNGKIVNRDDVALMMRPATLTDGKTVPYGMAWIDSRGIEGHRMIHLYGGTVGFIAINVVFPDDHLILVAASNVNYQILPGHSITDTVFDALHPEVVAKRLAPAANENKAITTQARELIRMLQTGSLADSALTEQLHQKLTPTILNKIKITLAGAGEPSTLIFKGQQGSEKGTAYEYLVRFKNQDWALKMTLDPSGKLASIGLGPA